MNNGIFDITAKKFYPVGRRSELTTRQEIKELLKIHHHHSELCCGCGIAAGRFLRLIPALTGDQKGTLTIAREDIDDHPRPDRDIDRGRGRLRQAMELLRAARENIGREEDNPRAIAWRDAAFGHIDAAIEQLHRALRDLRIDRMGGY